MMSEEIIIAIELICRRVTKVFFFFFGASLGRK